MDSQSGQNCSVIAMQHLVFVTTKEICTYVCTYARLNIKDEDISKDERGCAQCSYVLDY